MQGVVVPEPAEGVGACDDGAAAGGGGGGGGGGSVGAAAGVRRPGFGGSVGGGGGGIAGEIGEEAAWDRNEVRVATGLV